MVNTEFTIENFKPKDLDEILDIEQETFPERWHKSTFNFFLRNYTYDFFIAKEGGKIIGFIFSIIEKKIHKDGLKIIEVAHIVNIAVRKNYKKRGIGFNLLESLFEKLYTRRISQAYLEVRKTNKVAIKLYLKANFKIKGVRKAYYRANEDALIMVKEINLDN